VLARAIAARVKYALLSVPVDLEVPASAQARRKGLVSVSTARRSAVALHPAPTVQTVVQGRFVAWEPAAEATSVSALHSVAATLQIRSICLVGTMGMLLLRVRAYWRFEYSRQEVSLRKSTFLLPPLSFGSLICRTRRIYLGLISMRCS
jgi:hypothetical protein